MRRLAKHSREDDYKSTRDYQVLHRRYGRRFQPTDKGPCHLGLAATVQVDSGGLVCWGGYARASGATLLEAGLFGETSQSSTSWHLDRQWRRLGSILGSSTNSGTVRLTLNWARTAIDIWGFAIGRPKVPTQDAKAGVRIYLSQSHLIPETFYLPHDTVLDAEIEADHSSLMTTREGAEIEVKKCSYCGRLLRNLARLGALAFHKHNAKLTKHQNECRACKKWRINNSFNPRRTTDQLHESSVITRERKLFLREPEILQQIKDEPALG